MEKVIEYHQCGKLLNDYAAEIESLRAQLAAANAEVQEQARLNGMGAEREAKLLSKLDEAYSEIARLIKLYNRTNETVWMWMEKNQLLQTENTTISQHLLATQAHAARMVEALRLVVKCCDEPRSRDNSEHDGLDALEAARSALSTPINLDALHEDRARECDRLMQVMNKADDEAVDMLDIHDVVRILQGEAAAHRAKKESV